MTLDEILELFDQFELKILETYKKYLSIRAATARTPEELKRWQDGAYGNAKKLNEDLKRLTSIYSDKITKGTRESVLDTYRKQALLEFERLKKKYKLTDSALVYGKGLQSGINQINAETMAATLSAIQNDMKKALYALYRQANDVYRQTIQQSAILYNAGEVSLAKAIDIAQADFLDKGIGWITYKNGASVPIRSYAEMALRTNTARAITQGQALARKRLGMPYVKVSAHGLTCEHCAPFQGMILIDDVYADGTPDGEHILLSEAMAQGLLHPNCRHSLRTVDPEVDEDPQEPYQYTEEDKEKYENEQHQRALERKIRKEKRKLAACVDPQDTQRAAQGVRAAQKEMREFLEDKGYLIRQYNREKI